MSIQQAFDVGLVGCGPVSAVLANLLGAYGASVAIFEKERQPYAFPRAVHFDGEVMRVLQSIGVADEFEGRLFVNLGMRFVSASEKLLIDWPRPQGKGAHGWCASYRFHQPDLEQLLRSAVVRFPQHRLQFAREVTALEDDGDAVGVKVRDVDTRSESKVRCRYVVGCDGARSFVRDWMGSRLIDLQSDAQWVVVDVLMRRSVPSLSDWTVQLCDPARPTTIARGAGNRRRWEFMVMPGDDLQALLKPASLWRLLSRWISSDDAEIERAAIYQFNAVIAQSWRKGRIFIAGDAAHRTPPFLGQGLCAGVRDAANLAWKLAYALTGEGNERLLDSYESERAPHVREFILQAVRVGRILQSTSPDEVLQRDTRMSSKPETMHTPAPRLGIGLHRSDDPQGGRIFAQPIGPAGIRMDDVVGHRFVLVVDEVHMAELTPVLAQSCKRAGAALFEATREDLAPFDSVALLVRPDRYILGSAREATQVGPLLAQLEFS